MENIINKAIAKLDNTNSQDNLQIIQRMFVERIKKCIKTHLRKPL